MYLFSFSKSPGFHLDGTLEMKRAFLDELQKFIRCADVAYEKVLLEPQNVRDHVGGMKGKVSTYDRLIIRKSNASPHIHREHKSVYFDIASKDLLRFVEALKKNIAGEMDYQMFNIWFWDAW